MRKPLRLALVGLLSFGVSGLSLAEKTPKPPTNLPPTYAIPGKPDCLQITQYRLVKLGLFTSILTDEPGVYGQLRNGCIQTVQVFFTVSYFDRKGVQIETDGVSIYVLSPGRSAEFKSVFPSRQRSGFMSDAQITEFSAFVVK